MLRKTDTSAASLGLLNNKSGKQRSSKNTISAPHWPYTISWWRHLKRGALLRPAPEAWSRGPHGLWTLKSKCSTQNTFKARSKLQLEKPLRHILARSNICRRETFPHWQHWMAGNTHQEVFRRLRLQKSVFEFSSTKGFNSNFSKLSSSTFGTILLLKPDISRMQKATLTIPLSSTFLSSSEANRGAIILILHSPS